MKKLKIIIDILLFIITIALFNIGIIGNLMHEILGITLAILIIIHILLNFKWIKQVTKNFKKTNTKTKIMYIVDIFIMIIYLGAIICGILVGNEIFNFHMSSSLGFVLTHLILGRLAIITMFIHLGLHLDRIFRKVKNEKLKKAIYIVYTFIVIGIAIYFIYTLTHSFQWMYAFGNSNWKNIKIKKERLEDE